MPTLTVRGVPEAIGIVNNFTQDKEAAIKAVINRSAAKITRDAKKLAPVDTGRLRSSITMRPYNGGLTIEVGTNVFYAPYIEYGTGIHAVGGDGKTPWRYQNDRGQWITTSGSPAQPFLFPAFEAERPNYLAELKRVTER